MKAFVFPGQGAQFVGMGKDLYENSPLAKELFEIQRNGRRPASNQSDPACRIPSLGYFGIVFG